MKYATLFVSLLLLLLINTQAQQINFVVESEGETLGKAELWVDKDTEHQIYAFHVGETLAFPIGVSSITSMYEEGRLLSASSRIGGSHINIKGDGQYYHAICQGAYEPFKSDWVHTGVAKLFCERPEGHEVLIEAEGEVKPIEKLDSNTYEIQLSNGAEITFTYKLNDCVAVVISQEGKEWKLTRLDALTL